MSGEDGGRWLVSACVCFAPSTELERFSVCLAVCLFVVVFLSCPSEFTSQGLALGGPFWEKKIYLKKHACWTWAFSRSDGSVHYFY